MNPLKSVIKKLLHGSEDDLSLYLSAFEDWTYPKADLFHFIPALNRLDSILEKFVADNNLKNTVQRTETSASTKPLLLGILQFTRLLLENSTNRNLYNSYEVQLLSRSLNFLQHLNDLLFCDDLDVIERLLKLILRPAQRIGSQRFLKSNFVISRDRIISFFAAWTSGVDLVSSFCHEPSSSVRSAFNELIVTPSETSATPDSNSVPLTTAIDDENQISVTPAPAATATIYLSLPRFPFTKSITEITANFSSLHHLGADQELVVMNWLRVSKALYSPPASAFRRQLLTIRVLSIAVFGTLKYTASDCLVFI